MMSITVSGALAPANMFGLDPLDRFDRLGRIARHVGEIGSGHHVPGTAAAGARRSSVNQCRDQHSSQYLRHVSLLVGTIPGELITSDLIKMRSSYNSQAINGSMRTKVQ